MLFSKGFLPPNVIYEDRMLYVYCTCIYWVWRYLPGRNEYAYDTIRGRHLGVCPEIAKDFTLMFKKQKNKKKKIVIEFLKV